MIWERYFYKEICKTFTFLLFGFFALYVAIDMMTHLKDIRAGSTSLLVWINYYICTFSRRLDVLIPFTVLIGTIRLLLQFHARNELVALLVCGLPMKTLLRPFLVAASCMALLLYANFQFFLPATQPKALSIQENDFSKSMRGKRMQPVREVLLKDASRMFYKSYNSTTKEFLDVFWVASLDKVYHMKMLRSDNDRLIGVGVDLIVRDASGKMKKEGYYAEYPFKNMQFDDESLRQSIQLPRDQSITTLISQLSLYGQSISERAVDVRSFLIFKLTFPLLCLLAVVVPLPYCLSYRRDLAPFMIYLLSLGALFCFFLLLQVALVLAKSHTISPLLALGVPWLLAGLIAARNYLKVV